MSAYNLTPAAKAALTDIYVYTHQNWGEAQADKYLDGLYAVFGCIADKSVLWRPVPAEFEVDGYFTRYESHFVYWRAQKKDMTIVAILHQAMMQGERLQSAFGLTESED